MKSKLYSWLILFVFIFATAAGCTDTSQPAEPGNNTTTSDNSSADHNFINQTESGENNSNNPPSSIPLEKPPFID